MRFSEAPPIIHTFEDPDAPPRPRRQLTTIPLVPTPPTAPLPPVRTPLRPVLSSTHTPAPPPPRPSSSALASLIAPMPVLRNLSHGSTVRSSASSTTLRSPQPSTQSSFSSMSRLNMTLAAVTAERDAYESQVRRLEQIVSDLRAQIGTSDTGLQAHPVPTPGSPRVVQDIVASGSARLSLPSSPIGAHHRQTTDTQITIALEDVVGLQLTGSSVVSRRSTAQSHASHASSGLRPIGELATTTSSTRSEPTEEPIPDKLKCCCCYENQARCVLPVHRLLSPLIPTWSVFPNQFTKFVQFFATPQVQIVFHPCGHCVTCERCARRLTVMNHFNPQGVRCPMCRNEIAASIRVFFA